MNGFAVEEVAKIFGANVEWVHWVIREGLLKAIEGPDGSPRVDPISVEGLRRRLLSRSQKEGGLDPREAERVRRALREGARARIRALLDGRSYSTHPTIPPPPGGWLETQEDHAYEKLLAAIRDPSLARGLPTDPLPRRSGRSPALARLRAITDPPLPESVQPEDRHDEIPPPGFSPKE